METYGRLFIPGAFISIRLYLADNHNAQSIVDAKWSAAYIKWKGQDAIADHSGQDGLQRIRYVKENKTRAYVTREGRREVYVCTKKQIGHRVEKPKIRILDADWKPVTNYGGLVIYTCIGEDADGNMDLWLTYWQKINS